MSPHLLPIQGAWPKNAPPGVPNSCFLDNCTQNNTDTVFLDSISRQNVCSGTFCTAITNIGNLQGSERGQANFNNKVQQSYRFKQFHQNFD